MKKSLLIFAVIFAFGTLQQHDALAKKTTVSVHDADGSVTMRLNKRGTGTITAIIGDEGEQIVKKVMKVKKGRITRDETTFTH